MTIADGSGYAVIESGETGIVLRFDPAEMTTVWENTFSLAIGSSYGPYEFSPVVTNDGVYAYNANIHLAKYSKVSGERQWSAGSLVPHGATTYENGILVTGVDDTSVNDEEENGDGLLIGYSGDGLEQWRLNVGQGSKEDQSFTPPIALPSVDGAYLVGDLDRSLQLVGTETAAATLNPTPTTEGPSGDTTTQTPTVTPASEPQATSTPSGPRSSETTSADTAGSSSPQRGFFINGEGGLLSSVSDGGLTALSTGITILGIGITLLDMVRGGDD